LQDWVHDVADVLAAADVKGKDRIEGAPTSAKAAAAAAAERDAKLRAMFVVVPPGDESKPITCPVCRDQLKSEFLEDDEEWVWKNAIRVRGKVRRVQIVAVINGDTNSFDSHRCIMPHVTQKRCLPW
jgi:pre-mRNA cleavage complex 2 protein Pcf11